MKELIYEKLLKLEWLMRRQQTQHQTEHGAFADRTRGQGRVLALLKIQPEMSAKDLSYLLGIRQQSLNELLNKLEKNDYIERKPSEADKRVVIIHLTEKGRAVEQVNPACEPLFADFSETELATFENYIDRLITALEAEVGPEDESLVEWMKSASERMGKDKLKQLMALRRGCGGFGGGCGRRKHFAQDCDKPRKNSGCCPKNNS